MALLGPKRLLISEKSATYMIKWSYTIIWQVSVCILFLDLISLMDRLEPDPALTLGKSALCSFWAVDDKEASKLKSIFRRRWRCA